MVVFLAIKRIEAHVMAQVFSGENKSKELKQKTKCPKKQPIPPHLQAAKPLLMGLSMLRAWQVTAWL